MSKLNSINDNSNSCFFSPEKLRAFRAQSKRVKAPKIVETISNFTNIKQKPEEKQKSQEPAKMKKTSALKYDKSDFERFCSFKLKDFFPVSAFQFNI